MKLAGVLVQLPFMTAVPIQAEPLLFTVNSLLCLAILFDMNKAGKPCLHGVRLLLEIRGRRHYGTLLSIDLGADRIRFITLQRTEIIFFLESI